MVDVIVREWFRNVFGVEAAREGYGEWVREFLTCFYANYAFVGSRNAGLLQRHSTTLLDLFERFGLFTNTLKTKSMTCTLGKIRTMHSNRAYTNCQEGLITDTD